MASSVYVPIKTVFDDKGLKQAQAQFGAFGSSMKKLVGGAIAAVSIGAVVSTLTSAAKAASDDAKSQILLAQQMRNTAQASDEQIASVENSISALSVMAGVADDQLRPAMASLVRATGDVSQAQDLLGVSLDVAAATGKDLQSVSLAIGKATAGQTSQLFRMIPALKGSDDWMGKLRESTAGMAEAAGNADPYMRLTVVFDELKETLGKAVLPLINVMIDALVQLTPILTTVFNALQPVFDSIKPLIERLTPIMNRVIGTLGRLISQLLPPIMSVIDALLVALAPVIDAVLGLVDKILPPLVQILNNYIVPAIQAWADAMSQPGGYIETLATLVGDTLYMALTYLSEVLGFVKEGFDIIGEALAPIIQGFKDFAAASGIDFNALIQNLNPLFVALNALQLILATLVWQFRLVAASAHLDWASFGKILKDGPLKVLTDMKNKAKEVVDETGRLVARQANKNVKPLITGGGTPPTGAGNGSKAAADAAKKYADAYAKILETEQRIREEATATAMAQRESIMAMRDSFVSLLDGVKPLQRAGAAIGEFEQQVVDSFKAIEDQIASSLADGTLLADAAANLRAYAASEKATLSAIARQRDALTKKIEIAKSISAGVLALGDVTTLLDKQTRTVTETFTRMVDGVTVATTRSFDEITQGGLVDNFKKVIDKTKAFAKNLIELKRLGLNGQLFKQIVSAGVDAGGDTAQAIADGGAATVTELNDLFGQLNDLGGQVAAASTDVMYQAGEDVMNSFIQSLLDQDKALEDTATSLATKFAEAFRNTLVALSPLMALPMNTSDISLSDALNGYVSDQLGRTFTGPYNYYGQQMVGGLGANYNVTINAGAVADKASLPGIIVDALATYTRTSGSGALNKVLSI